MADELNIPTHRWYQPRYNISLPNSDFSKQWIFNSGIQKIDAFIGGGSFSPSTLFALAEPGVWFDPSDTSTLFQDPAGTTPVTAPGNTVGLMLDKSKGLALGAELVANGDFASSTGWTLSSATIGSGVLTATAPSNTTFATRALDAAMTAGRSYEIRLTVSGYTSGDFFVQFAGGAALTTLFAAANGSFRFIAVATAGHTVINLRSGGSGLTASIDNISVRELAGNHATQATIAARPTYSVEPVGGRRNLLVWSEGFNESAWAKTNATITANAAVAPDGTTTAEILESTLSGTELRQIVASNGASNTFSFWVKAAPTGSATHIRLSTNDDSAWNTGVSQKFALSSEWTRINISGDLLPNSSASTLRVLIGSKDVTGATDGQCAGNVLIWGAQFEAGTLSPYQRVTTQHDVTEAGVASVSYLYFDGVNDAMATSTITPGTDKAQVFAGVRKVSDAGIGVPVEFTADTSANNGGFVLYSAVSAGANWGFGLRGSTWGFGTASPFAAPITNVLTALYDIGAASDADEVKARVNGAAQTLAFAADPGGTGNFANAPLYIGARGGTGLLFTGHLYSLITRFGPTLDAPTITSTEIWVGDKTGIDVAKNISTTIYTRSGDTILDRANSTIERRA